MEFDLFLPEYSLAFEYQGEHHYYEVYKFGPHKLFSQRDERKRNASRNAGITLVEIPYWWDFKMESLRATVYQYCPELIRDPGNGTPISKMSPIHHPCILKK
jgi:hypothetical protein